MGPIKEYRKTVSIVEIDDGPVRVRADSLRNTVIVDIRTGGRPQTFVLPRDYDTLDCLGVALTHVARASENWKDDE